MTKKQGDAVIVRYPGDIVDPWVATRARSGKRPWVSQDDGWFPTGLIRGWLDDDSDPTCSLIRDGVVLPMEWL